MNTRLNLTLLAVCICGILTACGGSSTPSAPTTAATTEVQKPIALLTGEALRAEVERFRSSNNLPAISVSIVNQDKVESVVTGTREINSNKTTLSTDLFQLGSLTKAATATMIGRLVEQKKMRWDTTIVEVFPAWRTQIRREYLNVTVEQLLRHRSGLPREVNEATIEKALPLLSGDLLADRRALAVLLLQDAPEYAPNSKLLYSNIGYALAGLMAEIAGGDSYENLMQREVFAPLNIKAHFGFPEDAGINNNAGHTLVAGKWTVTPPVIDPRYAFFINAAGGLNLNLADYAVFLREHLRGLQGQSNYLSKANFQLMHTPIDEYGLGWNVVNAQGLGNVSLHNGTELTYYASNRVIPSKNIALAIACNCYDPSVMNKLDEFADSLLRPLLPQ
ncbi:serine hydrolase domain-containing protein [Undibacterium umbellatum]|uniref:Beta-lactamase family protein n=1 Tax=Undibacterium umbellatum TaxID=2762300 RepID=A0ABR6Z9U4_9BURK|nr:serine hydrolase domain-containing protein [Undibacterium umbellatum]MBC3908535.1 beta-lactamase family protein [Undibacterium umbellatum]